MYKKIMVPLDGSKLAECVLPHVETIIKGCEYPEVLLVRAIEPLVIPYGIETAKFTTIRQLEEYEVRNKAEAEKYLKEIIDRFEKAGGNARAIVINGNAAEALSDFATRNNIDLLVIATHGRSGVSRWVLGSVADRILRSVCVPVLMIRAPGCVPGI
jgi:nucleotide-binding universal stress UspA family protein